MKLVNAFRISYFLLEFLAPRDCARVGSLPKWRANGINPPFVYVVLLPRTASGESASRSLEEEGMQTLKTGAALVYDLNGLVTRIICHGQDLSRRGLRPWVEELAISVHNGRSLEGDADGVG